MDVNWKYLKHWRAFENYNVIYTWLPKVVSNLRNICNISCNIIQISETIYATGNSKNAKDNNQLIYK
jgi:hypothetical protein